jgi:hypothetical protein
VTGFRAWLKLNRCVRKGEQGIRILVPMTIRGKNAGDDVAINAETSEPQTRTLFKLAAVFDVSQTDPLPDTEPVPLEPPTKPIEGDSHSELLPRLEDLAAELGFNVEFRDLAAAACDGWCDAEKKRIVVSSTVAANTQLWVLVRELAHALGIRYEEFGRELAEVLVDCATFRVLQTVGLDVAGESVPYVAAWGQDGALDAVRTFAGRINEVGKRIEDALAGDPSAGAGSTAVAT